MSFTGNTHMERKRRILKYIVTNIAIAAIISILVVHYVIAAYIIDGQSMTPNFHPGERVLIRKFMVTAETIQRYDVVILKKPGNPRATLIKRVIALPGEIIQIKQGDIYIDGQIQTEFFIPEGETTQHIQPELPPTHLPPGHFFVIGDNHSDSIDSRIFGLVPIKNITGKAVFRYWPLARFGRL
jgi:signal peptidase I